MRKRNFSALAAAVVAIGSMGAVSSAFTIYQDNFGSQGSGTLLGGQAVQTATGLDGGTANATWNTPTTTGSPNDALWTYTGSNSVDILSPNGTGARDTNLISDAILPFTPEAGLIYDLEATITVPAAGTDNHWVGLSFVGATNTTTALSNDSATGLVIVRDGNASGTSGFVDVFEGAAGGTGGDVNFNPSSNSLSGGTVGTTLTIDEILNTTAGTASGDMTISWEINGLTLPGSPVTLSGSPAIIGVAFGDDTAPSGTVSSFSLTDNGVPTIPHWNVNASGDWNVAANWGGGIPNGQGVEADFFSAIAAPQTIYTNQSETLGIIHFNNSNTYELSGTGNLQLQANGGSNALIQVDSGSQIIDLPLQISSNTTMNVAAGATLTLGNPVNINGGLNVSQTGKGSVIYQSIVTVQGGSTLTFGSASSGNTLQLNSSSKAVISPNAGTVQFINLNIQGGSTLDLTNNPLIVNYASTGTDPVSTIVSYLTDGYNSHWTSGEILSSAVASLNSSQSALIYSVGYADGADGITGVPSGKIEILPTLAGDAKMQGNVVFGDFQLLSQYFGQSGTSWDEGDFTYNGTTNFGDFQLLSQNFGANASGLTAGELASLNGFAAQFGDTLVANPGGVGFQVVSVPEPASLLVLGGIAGFGLFGRRRSRKIVKIPQANPATIAVTASMLALGGLAAAAHAQTTLLSDTLSDLNGQTGPLAGSPADTVSSGQTWISFYDNNDGVITPATQSITATNTTAWPTTPAAGGTAGYSGLPPIIPGRYDATNNPDNNSNFVGTQFGSYDTHVSDGAYIGFNATSAGVVSVNTTITLVNNSALGGTAWGEVGVLDVEPSTVTTGQLPDVDSSTIGDVGAWILIRPNQAGSGNGDYAEFYATGGTGNLAGTLPNIPNSDNGDWGLTHDVEIVYNTGAGTVQAYVDGTAVLSTPYNYAAHGITPPTADGVIIGDRSNSPGSSGGNTTGVNSGNPADVYFSDLSVVLTAPPPITGWLSTGSGNWNSTANWDTGIPNAVGEEADFFNTISQASTVYTNSPITLSTLHFNNGNTIEITGTGSLTLQAPAGSSALVQVDQNTDIINLPLTLASNTLFNADGGNLVIANPLTLDAGVTLTQSGNISYESTITLGAGANFDFGNGTTNIGSLSLQSGSKASFPTGVKAIAEIGQLGLGAGSSMDLGQSTLTIDYGSNADPINSITNYLKSGYNNGAWNGPGIDSSFVAAHPGYGIGYADGADGVVAGLPAGEIEITPTLLGDATLSGSVTFGDFQILAAHFGQSGSWDEGNFLYGSTINAGDFAALAENIPSAALTSGQLASMDTFAAGLGDALVPSGVGFQVVSVPEPAMVGLLALGGTGLLTRRRRKA
jgi:hypothetical protein